MVVRNKIFMKTHFSFYILMLLASLPAYSQDSAPQRVFALGKVMDSFTAKALEASITLMREDSTVIRDSIRSQIKGTRQESSFGLVLPTGAAKYIVRARHNGYQDCYVSFEVQANMKNVTVKIPPLKMVLDKDNDIYKDVDLEGVVVKGTKVQMVWRGDTIVYDASSFNVPGGSTLSALVRQMPGAELKDNGDIYVNGQLVELLTLNGKELFNHKNKIMLDNLPYFMIKDVKVFYKTPKNDKGEALKESGIKQYVMNVSLKREYSEGGIANAEVGVGSHDRYMARLFALYNREQNNLAVFGNLNNVNESREPGSQGEWTPDKQQNGVTATKMGGIYLDTADKEKQVTNKLEATFTCSDTDIQRQTAKERFSTSGNIFGGSDYWSKSQQFSIHANDRLFFRPINLSLSFNLNYSNDNSDILQNDSTYQLTLTNREEEMKHSKHRRLYGSLNVSWSKSLPWGHRFSLQASGNYQIRKPYEDSGIVSTFYALDQSTENRQQFVDLHYSSYTYRFGSGYSIPLPKNWNVSTNVYYKQQQTSGHSKYLLQGMPDTDNSYNDHHMERDYEAVIRFVKSGLNQNLHISFPFSVMSERMSYHHASLDTMPHRTDIVFQPSIGYQRYGSNKREFRYDLQVTRPPYESLMPYTNTLYSTSIRINNPALSNQIVHKMTAYASFHKDSTTLTYWLGADATYYQRSWGTRTRYDSQTGVSTYMQDDVHDNWSGNVKFGFNTALNKRRQLYLNTEANVRYNHSVDFDVTYDNTFAGLSRVNTVGPGVSVKLSYRLGQLSLSSNARFTGRFSRGDSQRFQDINACDYQYGVTAQYTIPLLQVSMGTDITMFSRKGYNSSMMNTDDLIWNAIISRSFMNEKLTLKLQAFDILHELSNKRYSVDAQGRTETLYNSIPNYMMLSIAYRFNKPIKNKA
jgi:hypothetical protein